MDPAIESALCIDQGVIAELRELSDAETPEFFRNHVLHFQCRGRDLLVAMAEFERRRELPGLGRMAHALAGAADLVGATELRNLCRRLEEWCLHPDLVTDRPGLTEVDASFSIAVSTLLAAAASASPSARG
jgi:HPt (histidine-containing phosphotransfer) domain-containing protein